MSAMDKFDQVINRTLKTLKATIPPADYDGFREMCIQKMREEDRQTMDGFMVNAVLDQWNKNGYKQLAPKQVPKQVLMVPKPVSDEDDPDLELAMRLSLESFEEERIRNLAKVDEDDELKVIFLSRYQNETDKQGALRLQLWDLFKKFNDNLFDNVEKSDTECYCKEVSDLLKNYTSFTESLDKIREHVEKLRKATEFADEVDEINEYVKSFPGKITTAGFATIKRRIIDISEKHNSSIRGIVNYLEVNECPKVDFIKGIFGFENEILPIGYQTQAQRKFPKRVSKKTKVTPLDDSDYESA